MKASGASVVVRDEHSAGAYAVRALRRHAQGFLRALGYPGELSVVLTTDEEIQKLNRRWRRKNRPTDVLSFGLDPASGLLGDVVISLDTARAQAREGRRPLTDELARLLAHGLLHLLGHDHERPHQAHRMAKAEVALLGSVGLVGEALDHPSKLTFARVRGRRGRSPESRP